MTCDAQYDVGAMLDGCPACQMAGHVAILDVVYEHVARDADALTRWTADSLWHYHRFLPLPDPASVVTLGEGGSPLVELPAVAAETGAAEVWLKCEFMNPTGSFKDRSNTVSMAMARYFGFDRTVCTSTGNHGVSMAAYAARAQLESLVLLPPGPPPVAEREIQFYGGRTRVVEDAAVMEEMHRLQHDLGWYIAQRNAAGVGGRPFGNPFGVEGYKTIAFEVFQQLGRRVPDKVFLAVGGGDGAWGLVKAFCELRDTGLCESIPALVACQSSAGAPLVAALRSGSERVEPVECGFTIAYSIVERQTGDHALRAVRVSSGDAVALTDAEIRSALDTLRHNGVCVEPSSAATLAGLRQAAGGGLRHAASRTIDGQTVVLIATGLGLRWPDTFGRALP